MYSMKLPVLVVLAVTGMSAAAPDLEKRGLLQFTEMLYCLTGMGMEFNGYGCWCGKGGKGTPVDDLDKCCLGHDRCWDTYSDSFACFFYWSPFLEEYDFTKTCSGAEKSVSCDASGNSECERQLCECDRQAAMCFSRNQFHEQYKDYDKDSC